MPSDANIAPTVPEPVRDESESDSVDWHPAWHWEILQERERLHAEGLDDDIPAEEAFRQIYEILQQEQAGIYDQREEAVLEHREKLLATNETQHIPWEQAKKEMRDSLRQRWRQ